VILDAGVSIRKINYSIMLKTGVVNAMALGAIGPLFVIFAEGLSGSIGNLMLAVGLSGIADAITSLFAGRLSDRFGRKLFIVGGGFIQSAVFVGYAFVDSAFELYALQVILGVNYAMLFTSVDAFMADNTEAETRGRQMGNRDAATGIAASLTGIVGGQFLDKGIIGFETIFFIIAFALFVSNIFRLVHLREEKCIVKRASHL